MMVRVVPAVGLLVCSLTLVVSGQQRSTSLTRTQIKEAEQRLAELGYWTGAVDGVFDVGSREALIAFQKWERRVVTAKLTLAELGSIRGSEAPKPRDPGYEHVEVDIDRQVLLLIRE